MSWMGRRCEIGPRCGRAVARFAMGLVAVLFLAGGFQSGDTQTYSSVAATMAQPMGRRPDGIYGNPLDDEKVLRALNADRQRSMVSDTNKLVRLVNELDAEIAQSNEGSLTDEQRHKVAEIEKLAHNVREKMSTSVRGILPFRRPEIQFQ